jgi:hypothetical protein
MKSCRAWSRRVCDYDETKVGTSRVVPPWFRKTAVEAIVDTADQEMTTKLPYRISFQTAPRGRALLLICACQKGFGRRQSVLRAGCRLRGCRRKRRSGGGDRRSQNRQHRHRHHVGSRCVAGEQCAGATRSQDGSGFQRPARRQAGYPIGRRHADGAWRCCRGRGNAVIRHSVAAMGILPLPVTE